MMFMTTRMFVNQEIEKLRRELYSSKTFDEKWKNEEIIRKLETENKELKIKIEKLVEEIALGKSKDK